MQTKLLKVVDETKHDQVDKDYVRDEIKSRIMKGHWAIGRCISFRHRFFRRCMQTEIDCMWKEALIGARDAYNLVLKYFPQMDSNASSGHYKYFLPEWPTIRFEHWAPVRTFIDNLPDNTNLTLLFESMADKVNKMNFQMTDRLKKVGAAIDDCKECVLSAAERDLLHRKRDRLDELLRQNFDLSTLDADERENFDLKPQLHERLRNYVAAFNDEYGEEELAFLSKAYLPQAHSR